MPLDPTPGSLAQKDASTLGNMLCRDFLRGVCYRGDTCKFLHSEQHAPLMPTNQYPVCRDFQNGTCNRRSCKYAHIYSSNGFYDAAAAGYAAVASTVATPPQMAYQKPVMNTPGSASYNNYFSSIANSAAHSRNHEQTTSLANSAPHSATAAAATPASIAGGYEEVFKTRAGPNDPLCKEFQNGYCQRGDMCKFKHVSYIADEQNYSIDTSGSYNYQSYAATPEQQAPLSKSPEIAAHSNYPAKRSAPDHSSYTVDSDTQKLIESLKSENVRLHDEIAEYKKQITALNAQLAIAKKDSVAISQDVSQSSSLSTRQHQTNNNHTTDHTYKTSE